MPARHESTSFAQKTKLRAAADNLTKEQHAKNTYNKNRCVGRYCVVCGHCAYASSWLLAELARRWCEIITDCDSLICTFYLFVGRLTSGEHGTWRPLERSATEKTMTTTTHEWTDDMQQEAELRGSASRGKEILAYAFIYFCIGAYLWHADWQPMAWGLLSLRAGYLLLKGLVQITRWPLPVARWLANRFE